MHFESGSAIVARRARIDVARDRAANHHAGHQSHGPQTVSVVMDEQRRLFALLPGSVAQMALFAVNTGCREQEVCQLRWEWEVPVAELQTSVFVIPAEFSGRWERSGVKNREDRVVVLNDVAKRVIDAQRGLHREFVFVASKGKPREPIRVMNNTAWQKARRNAGLAQVRVHDLKHTFGRRLRTATGDAKSSAWAQDRGHHQSLQCPGTLRADTRGECGAQGAGIDVVASSD
jgi:integrase